MEKNVLRGCMKVSKEEHLSSGFIRDCTVEDTSGEYVKDRILGRYVKWRHTGLNRGRRLEWIHKELCVGRCVTRGSRQERKNNSTELS
jgi:hypothetical protein